MQEPSIDILNYEASLDTVSSGAPLLGSSVWVGEGPDLEQGISTFSSNLPSKGDAESRKVS